MTNISNALLILSGKKTDKRSLESGNNENCVIREKQIKKYPCTLKIKKISDEEISSWTKRESPYVEPNNAENSWNSWVFNAIFGFPT